jgi:hypothetical protein
MKTAPKKKSQECAPISTPEEVAASARFQRDLETRGEATELTAEGKLPPKATHAIIKKPDGTRSIKRGRFTLT